MAFTNYGSISGGIQGQLSKNIHITNYGEMGGVERSTVTIANYGEINLLNSNGKKAHFKNIHLTLQDYAMRISERADKFNSFDGNATDNSHLVVDNLQSVKFADKDAKMILDFGSGFEFGTPYLMSKLVVDTSGKNVLGVDFSRLIPQSDIYLISQSGDNFVVNLEPESGTIGNLYKSNIRTMNNFYVMSNAMIYPHKRVGLNRAVKRKKVIRRVKKVSAFDFVNNPSLQKSIQSDSSVLLSSLRGSIADEAIHKSLDSIESIQSLKSNESFAYKNNPSDSTNRRRVSSNQAINRQTSQTIPSTIQNKSNYYFILTPFINHNLFFESGRYNLSGFDYGFLTAFSGKITANNSLGAHFMMSYGSLGDSSDKNFHISNLNLNLGVNYKLDLVWDMYLKARGDFFYFLNQVKTLTMMEAIKPNNLGFGVSVAYGKEWDFKQGGILGIEGGLDYKALSANEITLDSMNETYQKSLYHLLYVDLEISYAKYFGNFGFNANLGIKGNVSANKLAKSQIRLNALNRSVDMVLDNDKILGYANVGLSYVLNARNFDMEFSLVYYGNYGDRILSNGGVFEWRIFF